MFRVFWLLWNRRRVLSRTGVKLKAVLIFGLLLWYATSGFLFFELPGKPDLGWLDALWWSLVTMATVGYGDLFPVTPMGRYLVGVPTMVFGIGFLGYLISEIAGSMLESRSRRIKGMLDITAKNHILIVNFNHLDTALKLVRELRADKATRHQVICFVDETLEELPQELAEEALFVRGDPTREETLRKANLAEASHVIILSKDLGNPHSDDQNLVTTLVIETLNPKVFTVVEIINAQKIQQVKMAGANSVICASEITSSLIVQELHDPGIKDIIMDLSSDLGGNQIYFVPMEGPKAWTYGDLVRWGLERQVLPIGLVRDGKTLLNCPASEPVGLEDRVIIIGRERLPSIQG
jgi:voltage-gated potassium channel